MKFEIYRRTGVPWHDRYASYLRTGLVARGHEVKLVGVDHDPVGIPILLGPNYFRSVQSLCKLENINYLMVNRAFYGDPDAVSIGWNGFNGSADHMTDQVVSHRSRFERWGVQPKPVKDPGDVHGGVVFGQVHTHSPWRLSEWYDVARKRLDLRFPQVLPLFRPHPSASQCAPSGYVLSPSTMSMAALATFAQFATLLNSTAVVECVLEGMWVDVWDDNSIAWLVPLATQAQRVNWLHKLAASQWWYDEILAGDWVGPLTDRDPDNKPTGPRPQ